MTRADLISAVALRMDEITPSAGLPISVDGGDQNPLTKLIDGLVDDGVLELYSTAPYWRLEQTAFVYSDTPANNQIIVEGITSDADSRKIIRLKVTDSFLRVAEIGCTDFQRPITEVVPEQSAEGRRQHNRFLIAKEAKPVGVMSHGEWPLAGDAKELCREIDCYSLASDTTVAADSGISATYIAQPEKIGEYNASTNPDPVGKVVPLVLIPALEWLIASRTFGARGDVNHAAVCQQNAQNLLM